MADPVLHVLAGSNGAGKSTLASRLVQILHLPFVNADVLAAEQGLVTPEGAYQAAEQAAAMRAQLLTDRRSFITETVFSHPSKVTLLEQARGRGYLLTLHIVCVPVDLTVRRVQERVLRGGHDVPEEKIRQRYERLWPLVVQAAAHAQTVRVYDNSTREQALRVLLQVQDGHPSRPVVWPDWIPEPLRSLAP